MLLNPYRSFCRHSLRSRLPSGSRFGAVALLVLWSIATVATGSSWFFQPAISVGGSYEENVDLTEEDPISTTGYNLAVSVRGGRVTERTQTVGSLNASFDRFSGDEQLDSNNYSGTVAFAYLATELDRLSLNLDIVRDTSRSSELTTTGNITGNVPRFALGISAAWARQLTERSTFSLGYGRSGARFDSNLSGLVDSTEDDINATYSYQLTERLGLSGALGATFYNPEDDQSYKGFDASLGTSYAFSETLAGNLNIGWQRLIRSTDVAGGSSEGSASGFVYGFSLSKTFERSSVGLSLSRSVVPTGSGELLAQESLSLGYRYQFSPRFSANFPLAIFENKTISFGDAGSNDEKRIFFTTEPSLNWRVTEDIVLSASYRYQYERLEEAGTTADSNAVFLTLSYVWPTEIGALSQ